MGRRELFPITSRDHRELVLRDLAEPRSEGGSLALDAGEAILGAIATGFLVGRLNHWNVPNTPIPIGLLTGGALALLSLSPRTGRLGRHLSNLGIGAAASWGTMIGAGWGRQQRAAAGEEIGPITAGTQRSAALPARRASALPRRPRRLSEAELAAMMREPR